MEPCRECLVAERYPDALNAMVGKSCIFGVALALVTVVADVGFVVLIATV
jgi:hypothetical protein